MLNLEPLFLLPPPQRVPLSLATIAHLLSCQPWCGLFSALPELCRLSSNFLVSKVSTQASRLVQRRNTHPFGLSTNSPTCCGTLFDPSKEHIAARSMSAGGRPSLSKPCLADSAILCRLYIKPALAWVVFVALDFAPFQVSAIAPRRTHQHSGQHSKRTHEGLQGCEGLDY